METTTVARVRVEVRRFRTGDVPAIEALNRRLAAAGLPHQVGRENLRQGDEPSLEKDPIIERLYVAAEGDEIRGGVWLKEQLFWSPEGPIRIGWSKYPVAESLINGTAAGVPASLLFGLLRQQPALMALGMGGHAGPFAKLLAAARWAGSAVPFFFGLRHPAQVLQQLSYVRTTRPQRMLADGLAYSGLGWTAYKLVATANAAIRARPPRGYTGLVVDRFDGWADELWLRCRDSYGFVAVRDSRALNCLYPECFRCLVRLRVQHGGRDVGWICARSINAAGTWFERHFGNLRLGILTDALAQPGDEAGVMDAGIRYLIDDRVDLIVTFQSHPAWCAAALRTGLFRGPSNCAFYRSPAIERVITRAAAKNRYYHLTYSDGDGPERV
jgi:hypothetical protein